MILDLAGRFDEKAVRTDIRELTIGSAALAKLAAPLNAVGWFFPVEIDLTWAPSALEPLLAQPPGPLWISVYESATWAPKYCCNG